MMKLVWMTNRAGNLGKQGLLYWAHGSLLELFLFICVRADLKGVGHLYSLFIQSVLQLHLLVKEIQASLSSLMNLLLLLSELDPQYLDLLFCCHLESEGRTNVC